MKKIKIDKDEDVTDVKWIFTLLQGCLCVTIIAFVIVFFNSLLGIFRHISIYLETLFVVIFGIGGIALYIIAGTLLKEIWYKGID